MAGARARAEALARIARDAGERWNYFVGLEGGLEVILESSQRHVFLENWAYVRDASGRGSFGQSGMVPLPEALAHEVVDRGVELSVAIDAFAGRHGIRDAEGAWGVLTANSDHPPGSLSDCVHQRLRAIFQQRRLSALSRSTSFAPLHFHTRLC